MTRILHDHEAAPLILYLDNPHFRDSDEVGSS